MADGTTIDDLQIEINTKAQSANEAIDRLVGKLDRLQTSLGKVNGSQLTGLANGVDRLGKSMQVMNTIKTADFTRLATNLTKLSNINVSALNSSASSLSHLSRAFNTLGTASQNTQSIVDMTNALSRLGGARVERAITNIPQLAMAMNNIMVTLSQSPRVSQNIINMTNALANLANQGSKISSASNAMVNGLNQTSSAMTRTTKTTFSLSSAIGKFYQSYYYIVRGIKGLWSSIEGTADYLEAFNYFNVALGKIGSDWSHQFEKYGYESAESYADSFATRLQSSLKNLSGLQISVGADGKGLLTETGLSNLGLNIQEITQYASQLASVTNSVGQTGEVSLAAANSLTKLGADLSSLFNLDYSSVMNNLQSGLIGQSRALYKYGIDITNATLQTYAYELGLEKAVSEMTQAEKMQLRMIAILDQSKVSWGDLANTINSPSNMMRQFSNNLKEVGMVLGQLFIPLLQKAMPVINGVTIALKRLLVNIAGFLGIQLDLSSFGQGYSGLEEDIDGVTDAFDDATASAKKLKTATLGIDELNINAPQDTSGTSTGGVSGGIDLTDEILKATEEYEKVWNEAFANMENKAQEWADKIEKIFEPITTPLENLFKDISIGDWFSAGKDTSDIVSGIFDLFSNAIENVDWNKLGQNIGKFLSGINWKDIISSVYDVIAETLKGILEVYFGSLSVAPLETMMISLLSISKLNFNKTIKGVKNLSINLSKLQKTSLGVTSVFAEFELLTDAFEDIVTGSENLSYSLGQIIFTLGSSSASLYSMFGPAGILVSGFTAMTSVLVALDNAVAEKLEKRAGEAIKNALTVPGGMTLDDIAEQYDNTISEISESFLNINTNSSALEETRIHIADIWEEISNVRNQMDEGVISVEDGTARLNELFGELANNTTTQFGIINDTLLSAFGENGALAESFEKLGISTEGFSNTLNDLEQKKQDRINSILEEMSTLDESSEKYDQLATELYSLTNGYGELEKALLEFDFSMSTVDFSKLFDGSELNEAELQDFIDSINNSANTTKEELSKTFQSLNLELESLRNDALNLGDEEALSDIDAMITGLASSYEILTEEISTNTGNAISSIQAELISRLDGMIKEAVESGEYTDSQIQDMASKYLENIDRMGELVNEGVEGSNWNDEITKTLLEDLFYFDTVEVEGYIVDSSNVETVLAENYEEIIKNASNQAMENSSSTFEENGEKSIGFYINGIDLAQAPLLNKMNILADNTITPFNNMQSDFSIAGENAINGMASSMESSANNLYAKCRTIVSNMNNILGGATAGITMGLNAVISQVNIPAYEIGGFPEDGLFMANHNELVGQFSNGRTAVANNDQIVSGIKEGVKEAVAEILAPYLSDIAQNTRETADKDLSVNIGDRDIARANARGQRSLGYALIT